MAVGNVIGNTTIALTIPFAIPALIQTYRVKKTPRIFLIALVLLIILYFVTFFLSFLDKIAFLISGFISIGLYVFLLGWNVNGVNKIIKMKGEHGDELEEELEGRIELDDDDDEASSKLDIRRKILIIVGSALLIGLGGYFLGEGLEGIVQGVGMSQHILGYVIVALGTNIEEFLMIYKSVKKKVPEIGTGAIIMKCVLFTFVSMKKRAGSVENASLPACARCGQSSESTRMRRHTWTQPAALTAACAYRPALSRQFAYESTAFLRSNRPEKP